MFRLRQSWSSRFISMRIEQCVNLCVRHPFALPHTHLSYKTGHGEDLPVVGRVCGGTLTRAESQTIQSIATKYDTTIDVVGSRAAGKGRWINTKLPVGKGKLRRSDIDFRIEGQADIDSAGRLSGELSNMSGGAGNIYSSSGTAGTTPPFIRFEP